MITLLILRVIIWVVQQLRFHKIQNYIFNKIKDIFLYIKENPHINIPLAIKR